MRDFLHHLFFPRESNNHRAKLLHHSSLLLVILFLLVGNFTLTQIQQEHSGVLGVSANVSVDELLTLTNQRRKEAGVAPLVLNEALSNAAFKKAQDMFAKNYWAHNSPDGLTPWVFIKSSGYDYLYAGENLAKGFSNAPDAVAAWMNSPGHRENMLSANYKEIGFAVATGKLIDDDTVLVVEMFGSRNSSQARVASEAQVALAIPTPTVTPTSFAPKRNQFVIPVEPTAALFTVPSPSILPTPHINPNANLFVAAIRSEPLIDRRSFTRNIGIIVVSIILLVLGVDALYVRRRKIIRVVSHNIDHIIFFIVLLLSILIMGRGIIL